MVSTVKKELKKVAYKHACHYTRVYFEKYLRKYIKKIGKEASLHGNEEVAALVERRWRVMHEVLSDVLCSKEVREGQLTIFADGNRARLEVLVRQAADEVEKAVGNNEPCGAEQRREVLRHIVAYAFGLREQLNYATSVAKTKVQEYWADRVPPLLCVLGAIFALRLYLDVDAVVAAENTREGWRAASSAAGTLLAFLGAFFLLYLRLPHSIDGGCKQKASDFYLRSKESCRRFISGMSVRSGHDDDAFVRRCFDRVGERVAAGYNPATGGSPFTGAPTSTDDASSQRDVEAS